MIQTHYYRTLFRVKCRKCNHEAYDADVEHLDFIKLSLNEYQAVNFMKCPMCDGIDTFDYIEDKI